MLPVLSATEACYGIKEINNNKEKSFCRGKLPFCRLKLPFYWRKLRKTIFVGIFLPARITILPTQIEKSLLYIGIFLPRHKNLNCKG